MRLEFRGLYQAAYIRFLLDLGGTAVPADTPSRKGVTVIAGDNWKAELEPQQTIQFSKSLVIPRSFITFAGETDTVDRIIASFRMKVLRGGG